MKYARFDAVVHFFPRFLVLLLEVHENNFFTRENIFTSLMLLGMKSEVVETNKNGVGFLVKIMGNELTFGSKQTGRLAAAKRESSGDAEPVGVPRLLFDKLLATFCNFFRSNPPILSEASSCLKRFHSLRTFFNRSFARVASCEFFAFFRTA